MEEKNETEIDNEEMNCEETDYIYVGGSPFYEVPVEVFLHICSFLNIEDIVLTLNNVCKRFKDILEDENMWKHRFSKRWSSGHVISSMIDDEIDWKNACFTTEREWNYWKSVDNNYDHIIVNDVHISSVDALLLINSGKTCVSGSRDRSIVIWNIPTTEQQKPTFTQNTVAHNGWIWKIVNNNNGEIYSCSWDNYIKGWDLTCDLVFKREFKCSAPVLSLTVCDGVLFAGDFAKKIYAFDPRSGIDPVTTYTVHQRSVLTIGTCGSYVIAGSEDRYISVYDPRTRKILQKIELPNKWYPNSSSMDENVVYIGDNKGNVHVFNPKGNKLTLFKTFNLGHKKAVSSIKHNFGYLITASLDGTAKISLPSIPPCPVTELKSASDISALDYNNDTLVIGSYNSVEFYIPKRFYD